MFNPVESCGSDLTRNGNFVPVTPILLNSCLNPSSLMQSADSFGELVKVPAELVPDFNACVSKSVRPVLSERSYLC